MSTISVEVDRKASGNGIYLVWPWGRRRICTVPSSNVMDINTGIVVEALELWTEKHG